MKINLFLLGTVFGSTRENTKDSVYEDFNSWCEQWRYSFDEEGSLKINDHSLEPIASYN